MNNHESQMREAIAIAEQALASGDVPVGALILDPTGAVVATGFNRREIDSDPTAHAEIVALRSAAEKLGSWRLENHTLVVTLEPCAMCAGAMILGRIKRLVYGADDPKTGACGSAVDIAHNNRLNHKIEISKGILEQESCLLLQEFFKKKRIK